MYARDDMSDRNLDPTSRAILAVWRLLVVVWGAIAMLAGVGAVLGSLWGDEQYRIPLYFIAGAWCVYSPFVVWRHSR